jgi:hypothetical protein
LAFAVCGTKDGASGGLKRIKPAFFPAGRKILIPQQETEKMSERNIKKTPHKLWASFLADCSAGKQQNPAALSRKCARRSALGPGRPPEFCRC